MNHDNPEHETPTAPTHAAGATESEELQDPACPPAAPGPMQPVPVAPTPWPAEHSPLPAPPETAPAPRPHSNTMQPVPVTPARWNGPSHHSLAKRQPELAGEFEPLANPSLFGLADALLKAPANVAYQLNTSGNSVARLFLLVTGCMALTGLVVASFSGGYQYLAVPIKLTLGLLFGAGLCLPSLYIFSCLSGTRHTFRGVSGALLMGLGIQTLLLMGFAPIAWIFSQSTTSPVFMGFLYFVLLIVSTTFGLALTGRVLAATGRRLGSLRLWNVMFVVVLLQLTTNLRPIVGEYTGPTLAEKQFFLGHWFESLEADT